MPAGHRALLLGCGSTQGPAAVAALKSLDSAGLDAKAAAAIIDCYAEVSPLC